jgi:hypothetical protein
MPTLPERNCSLLVRTDFSSDYAWQQVADEATRENEDGFRAYAEPVSDPAFDRASRETVKAALPVNSHGAMVLFIADSVSLSSPDRPSWSWICWVMASRRSGASRQSCGISTTT